MALTYATFKTTFGNYSLKVTAFNWGLSNLRVASCELRVVSCELRVASCELEITPSRLAIAIYKLKISSFNNV